MDRAHRTICHPSKTSKFLGSFAIRGKRFKGMMKDVDSQDLIRRAGGILSKKNDVDLKEPDTVVRMNMSDSINLFIEERTIEKDLLEKRKVGERPFFSPISLHPKYARALINLTGVKKGGTVLDPFCGTGGIVIEAAEMGMKAMASDFDEEMVFGCQENMDFYGLALSDIQLNPISRPVHETCPCHDPVRKDTTTEERTSITSTTVHSIPFRRS